MRKIKFRAWDKVSQKMCDVAELYKVGGVRLDVYDETRDRIYQVDRGDVPVMQYTGLKDKNGKEIYEGDIFKTENDATGKVLWDRDGWVARIEDERWHGIRDESLGYAQEMSIEVIGNIYENPDLCK